MWESWKSENNHPEEEKIVSLSGKDEPVETIFDGPATDKSIVMLVILVHFY